MTRFDYKTFTLGVNYWPRRKAMYGWKDFSSHEVEKEFQEIRALGLKLVRIFLLWEDFQPAPRKINFKSVQNLQTVLEIAEAKDLQILVTLFTGHMSGVNWVPKWALSREKLLPHQFRTFSDGKIRPHPIGYFYKDPHLLSAQCYFLSQLVPKIRKSPALFGWDLGNEPSILLKPRKVSDVTFWLQTLRRQITKLDSDHPTTQFHPDGIGPGGAVRSQRKIGWWGHPITLGIHQGDLSEDTKFHPGRMRPYLDIPTVHGYPNYSEWSRSPLDAKAMPFLAFLTEKMSKKKVLFSEFGLPVPPPNEISKSLFISHSEEAPAPEESHEILPLRHAQGQDDRLHEAASKQFYATEDEAAHYFKAVLDHLHHVGSLGALAWCFSDYHPDLRTRPPFDQAPHELYFGITRWNGTPKKTALVLKEWAKKKRGIRITPQMTHFETRGYFKASKKHLKKLFHDFIQA